MNMKLADAKREEGFTLIELLVVVIIIGILAAIAIPIFLNQRERAWIRSAESDARNAAIEVETFFNDFFTYPEGSNPAPIQGATVSEGGVLDNVFTHTDVGIPDSGTVSISPNVSMDYVLSDDADGFCFQVRHLQVDDTAFVSVYDSLSGGVVQSHDETNGCSALADYA